MDSSLTVTTRPTEAKTAEATSPALTLAYLPRAMALMPAPTATAVLGMTRTMGTPGSLFWRVVIVMPAATEMTMVDLATTGAMTSRTSLIIWGLTVRKRTSALAATSALSRAVATPWVRRR